MLCLKCERSGEPKYDKNAGSDKMFTVFGKRRHPIDQFFIHYLSHQEQYICRLTAVIPMVSYVVLYCINQPHTGRKGLARPLNSKEALGELHGQVA